MLLQAPSAAALEKLMVKHLLRGQPLKVRTGDPPFVCPLFPFVVLCFRPVHCSSPWGPFYGLVAVLIAVGEPNPSGAHTYSCRYFTEK